MLFDETPAAPAAPASRDQPLSVPELLRRAEHSLTRGVGAVWVEGELTEWKRPASGHAYFTLRDRDASVAVVMWRSDLGRVKALPEPGQRARVRGKLGVYPASGRMQLYADALEPAGAGDAAARLAALRAKLAAEGLFALERKRALPRLPRKIGVCTSAHGAAVQDVIRTIGRRFPVPILVVDCAVQGPAAPREIVAALARAAAADVDVIIVGRGGGSAADLAAFNDEAVVRAVAACPVPVISAVGHEVDLSLCDLAADQRASTPTAAAEACVPVRAELAAALDAQLRRLHRDARARIARARQGVDLAALSAHRALARQLADARGRQVRLERRLAMQAPRARLVERRQVLAALTARLTSASPVPRVVQGRAELSAWSTRARVAMTRRQQRVTGALGELAGRLHALSPLAVLERGYAVVRTDAGAIVRAAAEVPVGTSLEISVARGVIAARVEGRR